MAIKKKLIEEFDKGHGFFSFCKSGRFNFNDLQGKYPLLHLAIKNIYEDYKNRPILYKKDFRGFLNTFDYDNLFVELSKIKNPQKLLDTLQIDKNSAVTAVLQGEEKISAQSKPKWTNRKKIYSEMLDSGAGTSKLNDRQKIFELLHEFYNIRQERNQINHATEVSRKEISDLKNMIESYLDKIEKI